MEREMLERGRQRTVRGTVVSNAMNKTIVVKSERRVKHPRYGKYVKKFTTYYAHDEDDAATAGDIVELAATRPLSKTKRWRLVKVVTYGPDSQLPDEVGQLPEAGGEG